VPSRILIADDHSTVRTLLRILLESHEGWQVCAEVANGLDAITKAVDLKPDLVILDLAMPLMDGLHAARQISAVLPSVPILMHTMHNSSELELEAKKAGVRKVVNKTGSGDELFAAIEQLLAGGATPLTESVDVPAKGAATSADPAAPENGENGSCKPN
jgi:DNA-binding NarL/FixJ family response regulator